MGFFKRLELKFTKKSRMHLVVVDSILKRPSLFKHTQIVKKDTGRRAVEVPHVEPHAANTAGAVQLGDQAAESMN